MAGAALTRVVWGAALVLVGSRACADAGAAYGVPVFEPSTPGQVVAMIIAALVVSALFVAYVNRGGRN